MKVWKPFGTMVVDSYDNPVCMCEKVEDTLVIAMAPEMLKTLQLLLQNWGSPEADLADHVANLIVRAGGLL